MWSTIDAISLREKIIKIAVASNGSYPESYLLTLFPFELDQIDKVIAEFISPDVNE